MASEYVAGHTAEGVEMIPFATDVVPVHRPTASTDTEATLVSRPGVFTRRGFSLLD